MSIAEWVDAASELPIDGLEWYAGFLEMQDQRRGPPFPRRGQALGENDREPLTGSVERVTFHSPESGFCVLRVKARGRRGVTTVIGNAPSISPGEWIQASGTWQNTPEHGPQFKAELLQISPPSSVEGMERYLGSGMIRGIGPTMAKRLVKAFDTKVFDVIDEHPERLKTVDGIGPDMLICSELPRE